MLNTAAERRDLAEPVFEAAALIQRANQFAAQQGPQRASRFLADEALQQVAASYLVVDALEKQVAAVVELESQAARLVTRRQLLDHPTPPDANLLQGEGTLEKGNEVLDEIIAKKEKLGWTHVAAGMEAFRDIDPLPMEQTVLDLEFRLSALALLASSIQSYFDSADVQGALGAASNMGDLFKQVVSLRKPIYAASVEYLSREGRAAYFMASLQAHGQMLSHFANTSEYRPSGNGFSWMPGANGFGEVRGTIAKMEKALQLVKRQTPESEIVKDLAAAVERDVGSAPAKIEQGGEDRAGMDGHRAYLKDLSERAREAGSRDYLSRAGLLFPVTPPES
jgi:hypothetical protein